MRFAPNSHHLLVTRCGATERFVLGLLFVAGAVVSALTAPTAWTAEGTAIELSIIPAKEIMVGGAKIRPDQPPPGLKFHADLGIITAACMSAQRIHARPLTKGCYCW